MFVRIETMRLHSSQFVFLLLLACSLQVREDRALRMMATQTRAAVQLGEAALANAGVSQRRAGERVAITTGLDARELSTERTVWTMPHPAAASASVNSFTGMLRA
jgi:hypothetical protein